MRVQDRTPERLGPYRLIRRIGEGGMGVVYLGVDAAGSQVAIKALHPVLAQEGNARRRMAREVDTMLRVRSRYVAEVLDADLDSDPPYIVTRYVPGLTLEDVVGAGGPVTGPALARLGYGLAQALAAVHAAGVVHRDLKPGNVLICDGEPVVIDFGIAQLPGTTRLTMTGMFMGTPGYLAPEVIEGKDSGAASDVHSWGSTVAFAATGRPPYGTGPFETVFYRIMHGTPNLDTLPAPLIPLVLAALERDPARRPQAAELGQRIAAIDPAMLIPSPPSAAAGITGGPNGTAVAGPAMALGVLPATPGQDEGWQGWPAQGWQGPAASTTPMSAGGPSDVRDLLPPVTYQPAGGQAGGYPAAAAGPAGGYDPAQPGVPGGLAPGGPGPGQPGETGPPGGLWAGRRGGAAGRTVGPVTPWSPLVLATVAMVVAVSVMAPIIGTAIALGALVALRAAATTGRQLARRQAEGARRGGQPIVAIALYPLAAVRAVLGLVLVAPVALLAFCVTAAATIIVVPQHPLPQALALGAGALVAVVGLGPGSSGSRAALASVYSSAARSRSLLAIAYVGVLAIALWAGLTAWYQSPAPAYWPISSLHAQLVHFPTIRSLLTDIRHNLLRMAHQIGL